MNTGVLSILPGIINVKSPNGSGGESTLLVAPATASLSTPSPSSCATTPSPNTVVKGKLTATPSHWLFCRIHFFFFPVESVFTRSWLTIFTPPPFFPSPALHLLEVGKLSVSL